MEPRRAWTKLISWRLPRAGALRHFFCAAVCAALVLVSVGVPASAAPPARLGAPGPVGTVDTVAGPGFCEGETAPDPASRDVGALAVDASAAGVLWFESGPPHEGMVAAVLNNSSVAVERIGVDRPAEQERGGSAGAPDVVSAGGLAGDGSGGLLVAKPRVILRLAAGGLTTVAGSTSSGSLEQSAAALGDGGPLGGARFSYIAAVATDSSGNVYVADEVDRSTAEPSIRFLNRSDHPVTFYPGTPHELSVSPGTIDTIAGATVNGDDNPVGWPRPTGGAPVLAVAPGRLYIATALPGPSRRATVQMINLGAGELRAHGAALAPGAMSTVATVVGGAVGKGLLGRPRVSSLPGIAADGQGNLFLAELDNHRVRRVDAAGATTTFAGTGAAGFNGNDRPATTARLDRPYDVDVGPGGRVYISDAGNAQVRFVDEAGIIHPTLGNGITARSTCPAVAGSQAGTAGRSPQTGMPQGLAADKYGNIYATTSRRQIHRLSPSGTLRAIAGRPASSCSALAGCPMAIALRPGGGLYFQDENRILFMNLGRNPLKVHGVLVAPGATRKVAGGGPAPPATPATGNGDGASALGAPIGAPQGRPAALAADRRGNLFFVDHSSYQDNTHGASLRRVDARGTITTIFSPPERGADGRVDRTRCCGFVAGLAVDEADSLYVVASGRVWFLNRSSTPVVVHQASVPPGAAVAVAGSATEGTLDEAVPALEADLPFLIGLTVDRSHNLYLLTGHTVRRVDTTGTITTVVGTGQRGFNGDGLKGPLTALYQPSGLVLDACGNLLIADSTNDRVRRLNLVASCPRLAAAAPPPNRRLPLAVGMIVALALAIGLCSRFAIRRRRTAASGPTN